MVIILKIKQIFRVEFLPLFMDGRVEYVASFNDEFKPVYQARKQI